MKVQGLVTWVGLTNEESCSDVHRVVDWLRVLRARPSKESPKHANSLPIGSKNEWIPSYTWISFNYDGLHFRDPHC